MTLVHRVLYPQPIISLSDFVKRRGGQGIEGALQMEPSAIIDTDVRSGLRGRGGAGFPTGVKWKTVADNRLPDVPSTVIVNAAEGERGTFKNRRNPYVVVEGALVAARAVSADLVVFAMKQSFAGEVDRTRPSRRWRMLAGAKA